MQKIMPCLWFNFNAEEAVSLISPRWNEPTSNNHQEKFSTKGRIPGFGV
jgi:predicted 3-demethylubiquinone-9 3-methyltransferase (glyoxalase superfamily)